MSDRRLQFESASDDPLDRLLADPSPCTRAAVLLSQLADSPAGGLPPGELAAHLAVCEACRGAQRVDFAVAARLRDDAKISAPVGFRSRTVTAILADRAAAAAENRFLRIAAAAAVCVALAAGGVLVTGPTRAQGIADPAASANAGSPSARDVARAVTLPSRLPGASHARR